MNQPVMVIQTALFTCDCNYPVVYVFSLPTIKCRSYCFIETDLHLWPLSDCKQLSLWLYATNILKIKFGSPNFF